MTFRISIWARAWGVTAALLALHTGTALAQTRIKVGYTGIPDFAAVFIAKEEGFFEKRKLQVELQQITLTSSVPPAVLSDSVQIGGTTPPVFLQAVQSGLSVVGVANGSVYNNSTNMVGVLARAGSGIASAQDLVGKKLAVPGLGGTLHLLARKWLTDKGVDPKAVTFIEVPLPQMPDVLKGGSVDAVVTGEPFIGRMVQGQIASVVPGFASAFPNGFSNVLYITTRQWAAANGPALTAFREALAEAVAFANSNRDQAYVDLGKYFKVPPPVLKATPWPQLQVELAEPQLTFWSDAMRDQGMTKGSRPVLSSVIFK